MKRTDKIKNSEKTNSKKIIKTSKISWINDKWDESKGRTISIKVNKCLAKKKTKYQTIEIYESECFGNILVLDGVINTTEFDEFSYQEMITHVPLFAHKKPESVLIIGGGDGGVAREALKHEKVKNIDLCEIDKDVIELSKKFLPSVWPREEDPRFNVFCEDGSKFIKNKINSYDVIIIDSSDPWGPAESLFKEEFYNDLKFALKKNGIIAFQSESIFYDRDTIKHLFDMNKDKYKTTKYYSVMVPTYPSGTIGFMICSKKYDPEKISRENKIDGLKYYNEKMHKASFILPEFSKELFRK